MWPCRVLHSEMMLQIKLGSAECHSVKQDIITISYLRKLKKHLLFCLISICLKFVENVNM